MGVDYKFDVTVVIINYNSGNYLKETIKSLFKKTQNINYEVIIIDNNSELKDASVQFINDELIKYPHTTIIKSKENNGFGKANNIGIKQSKGKNILLLNPDVILENNAVKILSDYLNQNEKIGMVGPKVLNTDGTFQSSCMRGEPDPAAVFFHISKLNFLKNHPKYYAFSMENKNNDEINEVVGLSGCFMMVKKQLINEIGAFDEQFFLYQEETDWCYRAYKAGWKLIYNPFAVVTHYKGVTTANNRLKNNFIFTQSMMKFFKKHYWQNYNIFQKAFWTILIWGNFVLKYIRGLK